MAGTSKPPGASSRGAELPTGVTSTGSSEVAPARVIAVWQGGTIVHELTGDAPLVLGRSTRCDLVIDHPTVSRRHAQLHFAPSLRVEDLGSSNGTRVRGAPVAPRQPAAIAPGEVVEVGSILVVVQPAGAAAAPQAPAQVDPAHADPGGLVLHGPEMAELMRIVTLVAPTDIAVLIAGETGAGKEVIASLLHARSRRAGGPFVRVNCAAIPESLFESELFGHVRGAFTGAAAPKPGLLEEARGGTLLLDEIGELALAMQAKLLRALESREIVRVGALRPTAIDVRILAATNTDLPAMITAGRFRSDLYFRLNGITLRVPPLRERRGDLPSLAGAFLSEWGRRQGCAAPPLSPAAMVALERHSWPGNVRELRNVVERAAALSAGGPIGPEHLSLDVTVPSSSSGPADGEVPPAGAPDALPGLDLSDAVEQLERRRIVEALDRCSGNQSKAAKLLGISRRTLTSRLDAYNLPRPRKNKRKATSAGSD